MRAEFTRRLPIAAALLLMTMIAAAPAKAAEIVISCGAVGQEFALCRSGAEAWAEKSGHSVRLVSTPPASDQRLALYQQLLAAGSADIDVFQIDVVWPGILERHFVDLAPHIPKPVLDANFDMAIRNNMVAGRLVALPWFLDVGLLYYRKDLLEKYGAEVPETWPELTATAAKIQSGEREAGAKMWGYVFQARAYEGLTCNGLEWIHAYGGGRIVTEDGGVTVDNPEAAAALAEAQGWIGGIAPKGVLNYAEEEARGVFQSGRAVFMRNWPYAWSLANHPESPVSGRIGVTRLPRGPEGPHTGVLGGAQLAVSKYSEHREAAVDLVRHLTSRDEQRRRALVGAFNPTIAALYEDPEILDANPFFATLREAFEGAVARPSRIAGIRYNRVSASFWNTVHAILSGEAEAGPALARLEARLERIRGGGEW